MGARQRRLGLTLLLGLGLVLGLAACGPEGDRDQGAGAGSGGDPDNRDASVEMHGGREHDERIFYEVPEGGLAEVPQD